MVGSNVPIPVPVASYSFGGWKASLFGDLHKYGPERIQIHTRGEIVTSRWPGPDTSSVDPGLPPHPIGPAWRSAGHRPGSSVREDLGSERLGYDLSGPDGPAQTCDLRRRA